MRMIFIGLLLGKMGTQLWLAWLNRRAAWAQKGAKAVPFGIMTPERYERSLDYTLAKNAFGSWELVYDGLWTGLLLFGGVLPWVAMEAAQLLGLGVMEGWGSLLGYSLAFALCGIVTGLPSLPWEWWAQFRLEAKFGFNKSTLKLWIIDKLKGFVLGLVIGCPLIAVLFKLYLSFPEHWYLGGFAVLAGFQLLMLVIYPLWIMPLFNTFKPLAAGVLRDRLMALAQRTQFPVEDIHIMDGSRRSGHSNAFFTGLGRWRRIVLFDTLVEQLSEEQLEAVLAHEIGHYKRGHVLKRLLVGFGTLAIGFGALGWLLNQAHTGFFSLFGFPKNGPMIYYAFLVLSLLSEIFTFWITPLLNRQSRSHEYEADAFAKKAMGSSAPLVGALHILHEKNLSQLMPHPIFSGFYYSHPTLVERQKALEL